MRLYRHLQEHERIVIQKMMYSSKKVSKSQIARVLGRSVSTISREIRRNATKGYNWQEAHAQSQKRRSEAKRCKIDKDKSLQQKIEGLLYKYYSPEQVAYILRTQYAPYCSHETIYQWLYREIKVHGRKDLAETLFFRRKKRQKRGNVYKNRALNPVKKNIRQRPEAANLRTEPGHFEGDLIESKGKDAYIVIVVDRHTRLVKMVKVPTKDSQVVVRGIIEAMEGYPKGFVKTITFDNGTEFSQYRILEEVLGCEVYFADPYKAYQRGLNENINRECRRYLPKSKSFAHIRDEEVEEIEEAINSKPRKSLKWKTPYEVLHDYLNFALQT
ncbi:MAG: IS30 family transposase [Spirochaetota bacterium]